SSNLTTTGSPDFGSPVGAPSCRVFCARVGASPAAAESLASPSFSIHSAITCMSRSSPSAWKSFLPAFFISFHEESGSMAINPSARERQRRSATRRSCTASTSKPVAARSHSTSTRSIQARSPSFGLELAGFGLGFGVGLVPNVAPFADGNHCRLFARILLAEQMRDVVALQTPKSSPPDYLLLKTKLISFVWFAPIVAVWVAVPSFSCQALMVYVPGGRLGRSKLPSCLVTAKYGFLRTAIYPRIHGWM